MTKAPELIQYRPLNLLEYAVTDGQENVVLGYLEVPIHRHKFIIKAPEYLSRIIHNLDITLFKRLLRESKLKNLLHRPATGWALIMSVIYAQGRTNDKALLSLSRKQPKLDEILLPLLELILAAPLIKAQLGQPRLGSHTPNALLIEALRVKRYYIANRLLEFNEVRQQPCHYQNIFSFGKLKPTVHSSSKAEHGLLAQGLKRALWLSLQAESNFDEVTTLYQLDNLITKFFEDHPNWVTDVVTTRDRIALRESMRQ